MFMQRNQPAVSYTTPILDTTSETEQSFSIKSILSHLKVLVEVTEIDKTVWNILFLLIWNLKIWIQAIHTDEGEKKNWPFFILHHK